MTSSFANLIFLLGLSLLILATQIACADPDHQAARESMVVDTVIARGVSDPTVLQAMRTVDRHLFVDPEYRRSAYEDRPLPLKEGQTISQPYIVALMTELVQVKPGDKVLEIGTGSGYQAAVLAECGVEVFSIEIVEALAERAKRVLSETGYDSIHLRTGDGYAGWPEEAPFQAIMLTAAPETVPQPLLEQLAVGGRLVVPEGGFQQVLRIYLRTEDGIESEDVIPVRFVPMTGESQKK